MNKIKELFNGDWYFNTFYGLLLIAMATLPLSNWLMLPIAILMFLLWIVKWDWKEKWQNICQRKAVPALICLTAIYLMLIPGLLMSCNKTEAYAAFDCGTWLLAAPLLMLTISPQKFTDKHFNSALGLFSLGIGLHIVIILFMACRKFTTTGNTHYFYYSSLSKLLHPSYVAMYATLAFFFLLQMLNKFGKEMATLKQAGVIALAALLFTAVILLQSKAGLICFFMLLFIWIIYYIIKKRRILPGIIILSVLIGGSIIIYKSGWIQKNRLMESVEQIRNHKEDPYGTDSSEMRLTLWKTTSELIRQNMPWGVGTGDADQEIRLHALKKNYSNIIGHRYNAHCQYLQTTLETGILGLIALVAFCLYPLYYSIREKDLLYVSFSLMVILNIAVECMLKVRAGVDFIALFNALLFINAARPGNKI